MLAPWPTPHYCFLPLFGSPTQPAGTTRRHSQVHASRDLDPVMLTQNPAFVHEKKGKKVQQEKSSGPSRRGQTWIKGTRASAYSACIWRHRKFTVPRDGLPLAHRESNPFSRYPTVRGLLPPEHSTWLTHMMSKFTEFRRATVSHPVFSGRAIRNAWYIAVI